MDHWRRNSNRKDYMESLQKLISLHADILCEGHFGVYRGKENINKFIQSFFHSEKMIS